MASLATYEKIATMHAEAVNRGDFVAAVALHHHSRRMVNRESKPERLRIEKIYTRVYRTTRGLEL